MKTQKTTGKAATTGTSATTTTDTGTTGTTGTTTAQGGIGVAAIAETLGKPLGKVYGTRSITVHRIPEVPLAAQMKPGSSGHIQLAFVAGYTSLNADLYRMAKTERDIFRAALHQLPYVPSASGSGQEYHPLTVTFSGSQVVLTAGPGGPALTGFRLEVDPAIVLTTTDPLPPIEHDDDDTGEGEDPDEDDVDDDGDGDDD